MMLHLQQRHRSRRRQGAARARGGVVGMPVDCDQGRPMPEERFVLVERPPRLVRREHRHQVAEMLAQQRQPVLQQADRVLHAGAHRQHRIGCLEARRQRERRRRQPSPPPQHPRPPQIDPQHRVVQPVGDAAIMHQREIGNPGELLARLVVADALRLPRDVAARHHYRPPHPTQQQMMHRGGRQHEADPVQPWRDTLQRRRGAQQNDRRRRAVQQRLLFRFDEAMASDHIEIARHQRERLGRAALAAAKLADHRRISRIARQVETAEPLDRDDMPLVQHPAHRIDRVQHRERVVTHRTAAQPLDPRPRPAEMTSDRLRVESAVPRIGILGGAVCAEIEVAHRRALAVIRRSLDDGEARSTLRTVGERIPEPSRERVGRLRQARRTSCSIRRERRP